VPRTRSNTAITAAGTPEMTEVGSSFCDISMGLLSSTCSATGSLMAVQAFDCGLFSTAVEDPICRYPWTAVDLPNIVHRLMAVEPNSEVVLGAGLFVMMLSSWSVLSVFKVPGGMYADLVMRACSSGGTQAKASGSTG
jgi:hypothetical protein